MGCTPSTPGNGTSRTPDAGADSKVAIFPRAKSGVGEVSSPNSLTYPSISDQEGHECAYGRLFSCCWNCKEPSHTRSSTGRSDSSAKRISASLTGLHSLDPESTGLASNSGICTPKWHLNSSGRSSCASLCSVCSSATPLDASSGGQVCKQQQRQHQQQPTGRHLPGEGILVSCNVNSSELNCASQKAVSSRTKCHLSATISEHLLEGTNSGRSSDIANKGEKKRKMQTKSKLSKEMRLRESESLAFTNATLNSKDRHNHPAMVSYLTDTVSKEWTPPSEPASTCHCCVKHQHRSYRQGASHHPSTCTACPHQCCFPQVSPVARALELQSNQLQSENAASALNSSNNHSPMATSAALHQSSESQTNAMKKNSNAHFYSTLKPWVSQSIKLGRMKIENKKSKALLVLNKVDSLAKTLQLAAQHVDFAVTSVDSAEAALNAFVELQPEIVIIDARQLRTSISNSSDGPPNATPQSISPYLSSGTGYVEPLRICRSIRDVKGSEFTCILALVTPWQLEQDHIDVATLLQGGFNRCLQEPTTNQTSSNLLSTAALINDSAPLNVSDRYCHQSPSWQRLVNELLQIREFEVGVLRTLRSSAALLAAVDAVKDGVVITGPSHEILFVNNSTERMFGYRVEDTIGKNAPEFFQLDMIKEEINEKLTNFNNGKEWEGQIYHRRRSGDSVPIWNRILPINYHNGSPEFIIYVKEFPFLFVEKLLSPENESSLTYGSLRGLRKTSFDVKSEVRRPSLAKFNSVSMIEAPITRVINILIAIKEGGPSFLAPTLEKAIDILKNSEIFLPQFQSIKSDDPITSELVNNLINTTKTSVRRMSHEAASAKSSLSLGTPSTPTIVQPSLSNVPANVQALLEHELSWNFNVIELERITNKRPLAWLGLSVLNRFNVCQTLQCSETTLRNWLTVIESNYRVNPAYHTSTHATDVMQATAYFMTSKRLKAAFDPMDQAISLIAAIIHDIDHPGRSSAFLTNSNNHLALLYNDISVLESHHAARGFMCTVGPNSDSVNIFKNLSSELYRDVRQSVIDMVLATDMTKHFEHLAKFMNVFQTGLTEGDHLLETETTESESESAFGQPTPNAQSGENLSAENIVLIKRMLIKCADVSNPARPLKLCQTWAERISTEYCDQTDEEKRLGLKVVMPTFDRATCSIPKSQIGFIDFFANDLFEAWHAFGDFPETVENMNVNYQYWKTQQSIDERKQKKLSLESSKVSEAEEDNVESLL